MGDIRTYTHTDTRTHTHRERERERDRARKRKRERERERERERGIYGSAHHTPLISRWVARRHGRLHRQAALYKCFLLLDDERALSGCKLKGDVDTCAVGATAHWRTRVGAHKLAAN